MEKSGNQNFPAIIAFTDKWMTVLTAQTATTSTRSERPKGMAQRPQKWAVACQKRCGRPAEIDEKEVFNETLRTWQDRHNSIQTQKEVYPESGYTFSFPMPQSNGQPRMGLSRNRGVFPHPGAGNSVYGKTWPFRYVRMYKFCTQVHSENPKTHHIHESFTMLKWCQSSWPGPHGFDQVVTVTTWSRWKL